jgi:putative methyltransferase (TIGR04325 family)
MATLIQEFLPPAFLRVLGRLQGVYGYSGDYDSWEAARRVSGGYDSELILAKVKASLLKVKNGAAIYERDSVLFTDIQYSWPLLAGLLWAASLNGNKLNLVDFGGSLGSSYFQNRMYVKHINEMRWSIIEQENFVKCGQHHFQDDHLRFYHTIDACLDEQRPDVILLSSVLPYLEQPYEMLSQILTKGFNVIMIDRTPLFEKANDRITVQKVSPAIYEASYPAWVLNKDNLLSLFNPAYELIAEFDSLAGEIIIDSNTVANDKGFIFRKKR